jgi:hypothetical protein
MGRKLMIAYSKLLLTSEENISIKEEAWRKLLDEELHNLKSSPNIIIRLLK